MKHAMRKIAATALATSALGLGMVLTAAPASAAETCKDFVSDGAELKICTSVYSTSPGSVVAGGRTIEMHEYLRRHVITVQLQRQNASGGWDVVDSVDSYGVEEASATTDPHANSGTLRACATGGLEGHEQATVCSL